MKRRDFLKLGITASLLAGCDLLRPRGRIGLALGAGGARGLAHIPMLEVLDDLKIRPHRIAGTSIGAVMGAMYASGMSAREIRKLVDHLTVSDDESWLDGLFEQDVGHWLSLLEFRLGGGGLIDTEAFVGFLEKTMDVSSFEQLEIPLKIVTTDLWKHGQVVFERGELGPAIRASIAIPGLISPLQHDGRIFVDGGLVNPVPYDLLFDECDTVIAIDVSSGRSPPSDDGPGYFETLFDTIQIMQTSIMREKMKRRPPQFYIRPDLQDIRILDFDRADEIYARAGPEAEKLKKALGN